MNNVLSATPFDTPKSLRFSSGPLVREAMTRVDEKRDDYEEEYRMRWVWFFVLCGGVGLVGVLSAAVGFLGCRGTWKKHPLLMGDNVG